MNDKDKEALKERLSSMGFPDENSYLFYRKAWKAACEYKNSDLNNAKKFSDTEALLAKLTIENAKLRECVEFYADFRNFSNLTEYGEIYRTAVFSDMEQINEFTKYGGKRARQVLKELDKK